MSVDINATDFVERFKIEEAVVGEIGHGYVGQAVDEFFKRKCKVLVFDKAKSDLSTLEEVVKNSEVIFVCVPTPMRPDGSCHTGIVEDVIRSVRDTAKVVDRNLDSFI